MNNQKPKYTHGFADGSGPEYVFRNEKFFLTTAWGCDCCKPTVTPEHAAIAADVAHKLATYDDLLAKLKSLVDLPLRYNDNRIEIDCNSHTAAMRLVREARVAIGLAEYKGGKA